MKDRRLALTEIALASKNQLSGNLPGVRAGDDSNL